MNWFKTLTGESKALVATSLALILVLLLGTVGYKYATKRHGTDCSSLTRQFTEITEQFNSSKENAETFLASLETAPHAAGFTTFSIGKHGIEAIKESIESFKTPDSGCIDTADKRAYKNLLEANTRLISKLDNQVTDLENALKDHQIKTLTDSVDTKVEQLRGAKLTLTAAWERAKHLKEYATTSNGRQKIGQAETMVSDLSKKIESYTAETDSLDTLAQRITQLEGEATLVKKAKTLAEQIDREMASYVRIPKDEQAEKEAKEEADRKAKEEAEQPEAEEEKPNTGDVVLYGYDCSGDTFEYRKSKGWDLNTARADAETKCKSVKLP